MHRGDVDDRSSLYALDLREQRPARYSLSRAPSVWPRCRCADRRCDQHHLCAMSSCACPEGPGNTPIAWRMERAERAPDADRTAGVRAAPHASGWSGVGPVRAFQRRSIFPRARPCPLAKPSTPDPRSAMAGTGGEFAQVVRRLSRRGTAPAYLTGRRYSPMAGSWPAAASGCVVRRCSPG